MRGELRDTKRSREPADDVEETKRRTTSPRDSNLLGHHASPVAASHTTSEGLSSLSSLQRSLKDIGDDDDRWSEHPNSDFSSREDNEPKAETLQFVWSQLSFRERHQVNELGGIQLACTEAMSKLSGKAPVHPSKHQLLEMVRTMLTTSPSPCPLDKSTSRR